LSTSQASLFGAKHIKGNVLKKASDNVITILAHVGEVLFCRVPPLTSSDTVLSDLTIADVSVRTDSLRFDIRIWWKRWLPIANLPSNPLYKAHRLAGPDVFGEV
jgi:hypothetical protein